MISRVSEHIDVGIRYGISGAVRARLARRTVAGLTARQLVQRVIECRQPGAPGARTARVLGDVMRGSRQLDVELARGADAPAGEPIAFDDVLSDDTAADQDDLTLLVSEAYRGGCHRA